MRVVYKEETMPIKKRMVIPIHFNSLKYSDKRLTKEWIEDRLDIFWRFTLQSLKAQTNQEFEAYLMYDILSAQVVQEALSHREPLPENIKFLDLKAAKERIEDTLEGYDQLYWIRLDSDNLYEKNFIQKLYDAQPAPETQALVCQMGYMYDEQTGNIVPYYQFSPPFYTLIYEPKHYIRGFRYETPGGHGSVGKLLKCEFLQGDNFLVTIHGANVSNASFLMSNHKALPQEMYQDILESFGIQK